MEIEDRNLARQSNRKLKSIVGNPRPFLKWAGGKRQLLKQIDPFLPETYNTYIEPFLGGGALFFYLLPEKAILLDINDVLVNTYQVIKNNVEDLITLLINHKNEEKYYYELRNIDRYPEYEAWNDIKKASRTIFLNRCCFNGLYRVNQKGQNNVPFGRYKNPKFCDDENLLAVHEVLQDVKIEHASFEKCLKYAQKGDFIYFDPPYHPLSKTAKFTSYTKDDFGEEDQMKLFDVFKKLDKRKCNVMLSNSYSDFICDLYQEFKIFPINAKRAINSDATKRGKIKEALVLNYDPLSKEL